MSGRADGIKSHSFRSGLASTLGFVGATEAEIQLNGRWKSDAYRRYVRTGRAGQLSQQLSLNRRLLKLAATDMAPLIITHE